MTQQLPVRITTLAAAQIRKAEAWWRLNRASAPNAIREELQRAFSLIASQPQAGGRASNVNLASVRRVYMPRIGYHLYYHVADEQTYVEVVAFWHARRGEGPPI